MKIPFALHASERTRTIFLVLVLLLSAGHFLQAQKPSAGYSFYAPQDFPKNVISDVTTLLNQAGSSEWKIVNRPEEVKSGIILQITDQPEFKTKETFRLKSNGSSLLIISSSSNEGLVFGLYKHLRLLGFKFYLPDELYTIRPVIKNPFGTQKDIIDKPFMQIRNFAGTGGFGTVNPDPDKSVEKNWLLWKLRNGFGAAYHLSGHRGEDFILENKVKLQQNPQWLVKPISNPPDITTKINYQNKDAVNFYVDWTIKAFTKPDYSIPPVGHTDLLSIEPSDGGGYLNDYPETKKKGLPSVSDQVYGMANLAGEKLDKLFPKNPNIGVNLYAYSTHAEPPSFPLHPRVFVQLVPYQFQNIAYGPSFIKLWSEKVKRFGIYDYFKYADAQYDVPGGLSLQEAMQRLIQSVKSGSEGTTYETSYSKFSTGIPLWVIGRYMTDGDTAWNQNLSNLSKDLYKNAAGPIQELFYLFYNEPFFSDKHMGNAVALVDRASSMKTDEEIAKRITELKIYLKYTDLVYQLRDQSTGSLKDRMLPLSTYAWKIYESGIVHSYRIMQLASFSFLNVTQTDKEFALYRQLQTDWFPETERAKTSWIKIPQGIKPEVAELNFRELKKKYAPSGTVQLYSFTDVKKELDKKYKAKKSFVIGGDYSARGYFGIYSDKKTEVKIKYLLKNESSSPKAILSGIDKNYNNTLAFSIDQNSGELKISVLPGETTLFINASPGTTYRMEIKQDDGLVFFDGAPRGIMAFYKNLADPINSYTYDPGYYPSYVFIPRNAPVIEYKVQLNTLEITGPSRKKSNSKLIRIQDGSHEIRQFTVAPEESGSIWKTFITGNYGYRFLNIPDRYYLLEEK